MNTKRTFLERALASGVDGGLISAADVFDHVTMDVLAHHLPNDLTTKLLKASLGAAEMTPELVLNTLGTVAIAANVPTNVVWECVADAAERALASAGKRGGVVTATATAVDVVAAKSKTPVSNSSADEGSSVSVAAKSSSKKSSKADKTTKNPKSKPTAKPNVKVKGDPDKEPERLPGVPPVGLRERAANRAQTAPLIPRSEFDVDTDVGEDWSVDDDIDDIVEVVEEAEAVGAVALDDPAVDWKSDEETVASSRGRKR